jgi:hypothetical protein
VRRRRRIAPTSRRSRFVQVAIDRNKAVFGEEPRTFLHDDRQWPWRLLLDTYAPEKAGIGSVEAP